MTRRTKSLLDRISQVCCGFTLYEVELMSYFRPDMDSEHVSLIYDAGVGGINNKQMNLTQFRLVMYNYGLLTITKKPSYLLNNDKEQDKWWGIPRYCRAFIENKYVVGFNNSTLLIYFLLVVAQVFFSAVC